MLGPDPSETGRSAKDGRSSISKRFARLSSAADAIDRILVAAIRAALGLVFVTMLAVVTYQVFSRFFRVIPFWGGTEELARGLFIWVVLLGASLGVRTQEHFVVDVLPARIPLAAHHALRLLVAAVVFIVALVLAVYGWDFAVTGFARRSLATHLPATWSYSAVAVGGALMTIFAFHELARLLFAKLLPTDDVGAG